RRACRTQFLEGRLSAIAQWREVPPPPQQSCAPRWDATPESVEALRETLVSWLAAKLRLEPGRIDVGQPLSVYGLDSLAAIELMHSLEIGLGVSIPMNTFLQVPSLDELARLVFERLSDSASHAASLPSAHDDADDDAPEFQLSRGQQALYFLHQLVPDSPAYNIAALGAIRNSLDTTAFHG